jgi:hypothetical protein
MIPFDAGMLVRENLDTGERISVELGMNGGFYQGWRTDTSVILFPAGRKGSFVRVGIEDNAVTDFNIGLPDASSGKWAQLNVIDTDDGSLLAGSAGGGLAEYVRQSDEIVFHTASLSVDLLYDRILKRYKELGTMEETESKENFVVESSGLALPEFIYLIGRS